jgi:hypothetical protein
MLWPFSISQPFGICYGHLVNLVNVMAISYFFGHLVHFSPLWYYEKSGNPARSFSGCLNVLVACRILIESKPRFRADRCEK